MSSENSLLLTLPSAGACGVKNDEGGSDAGFIQR